MHPILHHDAGREAEILHNACAKAMAFLEGLERRPVRPPRRAVDVDAEAFRLPEEGIGAEAALDEFWARHADGLSGSAGPRYFGFVTGGGTPAALAADWLVSVVDQNAQLNGDTVAAALELATVTQVRDLLGLPAAFTGSFVSGATMANLVGLAIGRQWLGAARGIDIAKSGVAALGPVRVLSTSPHSSTLKAMSLLGLGRDAWWPVAALPDSEAIDPAALEARLAEAPDMPTLVVANAGTVNTTAFDDLPALVRLRDRYGFWLHVDAAFGGVAAVSPRFAGRLAGWEAADSITVDAHKWLNVPYDSAMQFTRHLDMQLATFQNLSPYLSAPVARPDNYLHLTPENSRRWRALPVWMALRAYGRGGFAEIVERCADLAALLGRRLEELGGFELLAPVTLNVVCFAPRTSGDAAAGRDAFLEALNRDGRVLCTPTELFGRPGVRAALVNWRTRMEDIDLAFAAMRDALDASGVMAAGAQ
ncbi:pyridoxal phosphate-dependent decarboxylase family protein [Paludibacterium paludis]|uniref:Aspartate aminotransferase family protein n=1 Tax=Paludibacterium paludis TaxID=1225769 RepID=A0A918NYH9_9NEIS|nr:pyridoxal-dependent decarboxylase [Paludibacterium paludis]GGY05115.1 aspartate aminotransferase family protein [Paludibacterium paludis]